MKKITFFSMILLFIGFSAFAQKGNNQIGVGLDVGLPMGDFSNGYGVGFGGTAKALYGIGSSGQVELTLGYIGFGAKNSSSDVKGSTNMIPIMFGYRHHLANGIYLEPQLGLMSVSSKVKMPEMGGFGGTYKSSSTNLGIAVGAGYLYENFDFSLRYQLVSASGGSLGFFGLRVGYNFDLDLNL